MTSGSLTKGELVVEYQEYKMTDDKRKVEFWCGDKRDELVYDPYKDSVRKMLDAKIRELG